MAAILLLFAVTCAAQTPITLQNPSFETHNAFTSSVSGSSWNCGPIPNWTTSGDPCTGSYQPPPSTYPTIPDGTIVAFCKGCTISQDTGIALLANQDYTLSAYIGGRGDTGTWSVTLLAGGAVLATASGPNSAIPAGTFQKKSVTYSAPASPPTGTITVQVATANDYADFDNVTLTAGMFTFPGSGGGTGFTITLLNGALFAPSCTNADGQCSLSVQVCDLASPPNCTIYKSGNVSWIKDVTLPNPQRQFIPIISVSSP